jgi:hypothetical protein
LTGEVTKAMLCRSASSVGTMVAEDSASPVPQSPRETFVCGLSEWNMRQLWGSYPLFDGF